MLTSEERALIEEGKRGQVEDGRRQKTDAIGVEFGETVERETGRPVQTHIAYIRVISADVVLHFFLFEDGGEPVPGAGA